MDYEHYKDGNDPNKEQEYHDSLTYIGVDKYPTSGRYNKTFYFFEYWINFNIKLVLITPGALVYHSILISVDWTFSTCSTQVHQ